MEIWQLWAIAGFILLILEMFTPATFFLTLSGASFFAGVSSFFFPESFPIQVVCFVVFLPIFYFAIKPHMDKKEKMPDLSGMDAKYIGKTAVVSRPIGVTPDKIGEIKIYGEVWQAKSVDDCKIDVNSTVEIVRNESLVMLVKKCEE